MMVFYSIAECRKVYVNTILVLVRSLFVRDELCFNILISKNDQFCLITLAKKANIFN